MILATDTVKDVVVATNPSLRVVSASDRNVSHACAPSVVRPKTHVASEASDYRHDYTRLWRLKCNIDIPGWVTAQDTSFYPHVHPVG